MIDIKFGQDRETFEIWMDGKVERAGVSGAEVQEDLSRLSHLSYIIPQFDLIRKALARIHEIVEDKTFIIYKKIGMLGYEIKGNREGDNILLTLSYYLPPSASLGASHSATLPILRMRIKESGDKKSVTLKEDAVLGETLKEWIKEELNMRGYVLD